MCGDFGICNCGDCNCHCGNGASCCADGCAAACGCCGVAGASACGGCHRNLGTPCCRVALECCCRSDGSELRDFARNCATCNCGSLSCECVACRPCRGAELAGDAACWCFDARVRCLQSAGSLLTTSFCDCLKSCDARTVCCVGFSVYFWSCADGNDTYDNSGGENCSNQNWGWHPTRDVRIGRLCDIGCCDDESTASTSSSTTEPRPCCPDSVSETWCAWLLCPLCVVSSLLAHSQNEFTNVGTTLERRPHCGHCCYALFACPCAMYKVRDNLRMRLDLERVECVCCNDACACMFCLPCMIAQFARASHPWEWIPWRPVPSDLPAGISAYPSESSISSGSGSDSVSSSSDDEHASTTSGKDSSSSESSDSSTSGRRSRRATANSPRERDSTQHLTVVGPASGAAMV